MKKIILISALLLVLIPAMNAQTKKSPDKWLRIPEPSLKQDSSGKESARRKNIPDTLLPNIRLPRIIPDNRPVNRFYSQRFEPKESRFLIKPDTSVKYYLIIKEPPEMGSYK